jgi:glycosyltransferase involved in cell wall biosynthesis
MHQLSVVIITFNEERNIARCLESVKDIADEIIVLDSYSTDRTEAICRDFGVQFYQQIWHGYSDQKNMANELARYDFIFSIDADECLSPELTQSIIKIKSTGLENAYTVNRLNNYCGQWIYHTSWYPDTKLRLWNKKKGKWAGLIHENVSLTSSVPIQHLTGHLWHYSYYSISEHINQANKFSDLGAEQKFKAGHNASIIKIITAPFFKFIKEYFLKKGLLDGWNGFVISIISAHETFLKYAKLKSKYSRNF